jgi:hypothetical protein
MDSSFEKQIVKRRARADGGMEQLRSLVKLRIMLGGILI